MGRKFEGIEALAVEMIRQAARDLRNAGRREDAEAYLRSRHCADVLEYFGVDAALSRLGVRR